MVGNVFRQDLLYIQVLPTHPPELNTHVIFVFLLLLATPDSLPHSYDRGGEDVCFQFESQDGSLGNFLVSFKTDSPATDVDSNTSEEFLFELFGAYRSISQAPYFTESWKISFIFQDGVSLTGEDTFLDFRSLPSTKYFIVFSKDRIFNSSSYHNSMPFPPQCPIWTFPGSDVAGRDWRSQINEYEYKPSPDTPLESGTILVVMTDLKGRTLLEERLKEL